MSRGQIVKKILATKQAEQRVAKEDLDAFVATFNGLLDNGCFDFSKCILPDDYKNSRYQQAFYEMIGKAYGPHAREILESRPNLTLSNISTFKIFEPSIAETFGTSFVHQLLNFDYGLLIGHDSYIAVLDEIITNKESLKAFKFCYDLLNDRDPDNVYNYTRLFVTYSNYTNLFNELYQNRENLTKEQVLDMYDLICDTKNTLNVNSIAEMGEQIKALNFSYDKAVYELTKRHRKQPSNKDVAEVKRLLFARYFGLVYKDQKEGGNQLRFSRNIKDAKMLIQYYNMIKMLNYNANITSFRKDALSALSSSEIRILRIICAVDRLTKDTDFDKLVKLYKCMKEYGDDKIIRPGDINNLIMKMHKIYENDLKSNLTEVKDLDKVVAKQPKLASKEYILQRSQSGKVYRIPVYHLKGCDFTFLNSTTESKVAKERFSTESDDMIKKWHQLEGGATQICATLATSDSIKGMGFYEQDTINYFFGKSQFKLITMSNQDNWSSHGGRNPNVSSNYQTNFVFTDELVHASVDMEYNEVAIERYNLDGSRVIPEGLVKMGKMPHERILQHAADFTEYCLEHGLKPDDYVMPIVMIDEEYYQDRSTDLRRRAEFVEKLESFDRLRHDNSTQQTLDTPETEAKTTIEAGDGTSSTDSDIGSYMVGENIEGVTSNCNSDYAL